MSSISINVDVDVDVDDFLGQINLEDLEAEIKFRYKMMDYRRNLDVLRTLLDLNYLAPKEDIFEKINELFL